MLRAQKAMTFYPSLKMKALCLFTAVVVLHAEMTGTLPGPVKSKLLADVKQSRH